MAAFDFVVDRTDLSVTRFGHDDPPRPADGQAVLGVERFGFSANNITYATLGDEMGYWRFFPADGTWGRVPVWGYAHVVTSLASSVEEGARYFGYLPMSSHLVVTPGRERPAGFTDVAEHRSSLPSVYQRYLRVSDAAASSEADDDQEAIWRPLFMTSFGAADFLLDRDLYGAERVVLSSASSKTALGIAFLLRDGSDTREVVGLTSARNVAFCAGTGYYDRVVAYDAIADLRPAPQVLVDLTADARIVGEAVQAAGDGHRRLVILGGTHWQDREQPLDRLDPEAELFFLPTWITKRNADWGPSGFTERYRDAWKRFRPTVEAWMRVVHDHGETGVESTYRTVLDGGLDPSLGYVVVLDD